MAADHRYLKNIYLDVYAADPPVRAVYMYDETVLILVSNSNANLSFLDGGRGGNFRHYCT
jgi:hypothetical protein